ncbi:MAG: adenylate/guanylate cyclase domain-containing protein [Bacteroidota bacterium]
MTYFWGLLIVLLPWTAALSQDRSAMEPPQITQSALEDVERLKALIALSHQRKRNAPDQACRFAEEARRLADELRYEEEFAEACLALGDCKWNQGTYGEAFDLFMEAMKTYRELDDSVGIATTNHYLAKVEWRYGNFIPAMEKERLAYQSRKSAGDSAATMESLYWLGILNADVFEYQGALSYYDQALRMATAQADSQMIANIYNKMGRAWRKQAVYNKALLAHQRSLPIYEKLRDSLGISDYYNNVGSIYRRQGEYELALDHFFEALTIQKIIGDQEGLADGYNDIGTTFCQKGNFGAAVDYLERGLEVAQLTGLKDDVRYAYASLSAVYDSLGNHERSLFYYRQMAALKDSLMDVRKAQQLAHWEVQYESNRMEQQIETLTLRGQRNQLVGYVLFLVLALLGLFGAYMYQRARSQRRLRLQLERKNGQIELEKMRSEKLLLNILPQKTADELMAAGRAKPQSYQAVTVLFSDFKGFTERVQDLSPRELVQELDECFEAFDLIMEKHGVEKIKTIGDAYMAATGLPDPSPDHAARMVRAAMEMQAFLNQLKEKRKDRQEGFFEARIGIHSGPVIAGIVGRKKFSYDIWGDTVNLASRMESAGKVGKVNISESTYKLVQHEFICHPRGKIRVKGKGEVDMYFVDWEV